MADDDPRGNPLERQLAAAMKLVETTRRLVGVNDLDTILAHVTGDVCDALDCERASLFLYDERRQELYTRVATELEIEEIRSPIDSGITGWVARRRKVANIPEPSVDARWNSAIDRRTGYQTRNILAAPLLSLHDNHLVGVLELINKREGSFDEFDEKLVEAFAAHAAAALERARLLEEARRSEELRLSVEMARNIQRSFLPAELPQIAGYELAAWWQPTEAVGGDYYDVVRLPDGRLGLVMADVSGHGFPASLIMASVRAMVHVLSRHVSEPERILSWLAESCTADLHKGAFITFLMVALDPTSHEAAFANAGHGPAVHYSRADNRFHYLQPTTVPIGVLDQYDVSPGPAFQMEPGDLLVLATDGAVEVKNEQGELFGRERLERLIDEHRDLPAAQLLATLRQAIENFYPDEHPKDDITLLVLERKLS